MSLNGVTYVPIDKVRLSGDNMREDVGEIEELEWSIRKHGILVPLLVTERKGHLLLVGGHRRLAAARRAGLQDVPVVSKEMTEEERLELMLTENIHRKHLSPLEEAHAFEGFIKKGQTQMEIGSRIGKSQVYVSNRMLLLNCDPDVQRKVHRGELALTRAIDPLRVRRSGGGHNEHKDDGEQRWQLYYIDRLVGWLETGRIRDDEEIASKLQLLGRTLKAFVDRAASEISKSLPAGVHMCDRCGTVVGVSDCCKEHGELCEECKDEAHGEAA